MPLFLRSLYVEVTVNQFHLELDFKVVDSFGEKQILLKFDFNLGVKFFQSFLDFPSFFLFHLNNVCFIEIRSRHSNNTLLSLLQIFMKQTLFIQGIDDLVEGTPTYI